MADETNADAVEVTEDELLSMDDEQLEKHLSGESVETEGKDTTETEESNTDETEGNEEVSEESTDKEVTDKQEEEKPEGYDKWTDNERAMYWENKKSTKRAQEAEARLREQEIEIAKIKAVQEAKQQEFMKQQTSTATQPQSELDKVMAKLDEANKKHMETYGTQYQLSVEDYRAIEAAKKADYAVEQERYGQQQQQQKMQQFVQYADRCEAEFSEKLKSEGLDDYGHVFQNIVQPQILAELKQSGGRFSSTLYEIQNAVNPAEAAYMSMLKTPEGRKYWQERQEKINKVKVAKEVIGGGKKITTTSASARGGRAGDTKTRITPQELAANFDKYADKLSDEQMIALSSGEEVFVD